MSTWIFLEHLLHSNATQRCLGGDPCILSSLDIRPESEIGLLLDTLKHQILRHKTAVILMILQVLILILLALKFKTHKISKIRGIWIHKAHNGIILKKGQRDEGCTHESAGRMG